MAEFIFKKMVCDAGFVLCGESASGENEVEEAGRKNVFRVDSAAVSYEEIWNDIYPPAKRTLAAHEIPYDRHSAHRITDAEANEYDVIVTMDSSNRRLLSRIISPSNMAKVHGIMEYAGKDSDVSDPWYTGDFETTYRDITKGCAGLLEYLLKTD